MKIALASKSPRRKELLRQIVPDFEIFPSKAEEFHSDELTPIENAEANALRKACNIEGPTPIAKTPVLIIGADTIVVCEGRILGKPATREEAEKMLLMLSGKIHEVITGVAILYKDGAKEGKKVSHDVDVRVFHVITRVKMKALKLKDIEKYYSIVNPLDKAGAYAIQEGPKIVEKIWGSYTNVVGLPVEELRDELGDIRNSKGNLIK